MSFLFGFSGRIGRLQWWFAQMVVIPVVVGLGFGTAYLITATDDPTRSAAASEGLDSRALAMVACIIAIVILMTWINIASTVKRYHDRDKSGAWFCITFIPLIGPIWLLVECGFLPGSPGGNGYGSPPGSGNSLIDADFGNEAAFEYSMPKQAARVVPASQPTAVAPRRASAGRQAAPSSFGRRGVS